MDRSHPSAQIAEDGDVLDIKTADEEATEDGHEEERSRRRERCCQASSPRRWPTWPSGSRSASSATSRRRSTTTDESKFDKLREILTDPKYAGEKFLIFTEHRDTLDYLVRRLEGMGYTGQVAQIHGGMDYTERQEQVELFRKPHDEGGARFLVCTDAAGEGINSSSAGS